MGKIIRVENLSKRYIIGHQQKGNKTFREALSQSIANLGSKFIHPFSRNISSNSPFEEFWALKDICFEVEQGDRIGIIGRNGAGKSTLLKVLSRITEPTCGKITINGRIASLLEVGTGFNSELTGRENIFLNGAILGMPHAEIKQKFDEIVDFAGVEKFLDTPVKRYSSGMYVRLAFAVAAHLEPEILIVDEVLAVGDSEFQKKCLGKMQDISQKGGRTVIFVSHNMSAISSLCQKAILLDKGNLIEKGTSDFIIERYLNLGNNSSGEISWKNGLGDELIKLFSARILNSENEISINIDVQKHFFLELEYELLVDTSDVRIGFRVITSTGIVVFTSLDNDDDQKRLKKKGIYSARIELPANFFNTGTYYITIAADIPHKKLCFFEENCLSFNIEHTGGVGGDIVDGRLGIIRPFLRWNF